MGIFIVSNEEEREEVESVFNAIDRFIDKAWSDLGMSDECLEKYNELSCVEILIKK